MKIGIEAIRGTLLAASMLGGLALADQATASELTIGRANEQSSMDPLFSRTGNNQMTAQHIFDRLVELDAHLGMHPGLAESWKVIDPTTWEIKLRKGVKFHDGSDFTAEDVAFSFTRAKNVPNSPAPFGGAVANVASTEIVDPLTLRIKTPQPTPQLMEQIGLVYIVSHIASANVASSDFQGGKPTIGTGPYKYKEWVPNDRLVLTANPDYWHGKPEFDTVTIKFIKNEAARVAALLSGGVDLIDEVPPTDVDQITRNPKVKLFSIPSGRLIYLAVDGTRDQSPFVTDKAGKPLDKNPLKDARVRLALSKMINRKIIVDRALNGSGEPSGQIAPPGLGGHDPALKPEALDVEGAKKLLADAGYPEGFGLTLHSSSDRFPGDSQIAQAIGQMFARGGIKMNGVVTQPYNVYATAASKQEYSAFIFSYGLTTGNSSQGLLNVLATYDRDAGMGAFNRTRYSNPAFDKALKAALSEFDETKRNDGFKVATDLVFKDQAIIPLYWQKVHWAARAGVEYEANMNEETTAMNAKLAK